MRTLPPTQEALRAARREAVRASLAATDAAELEARLRRFLETRCGSLNEWDQRFLDFIELHRGERLLAATAGDGFEIVFSPRRGAGYWLFEIRGGGWGKGFLDAQDARRLIDLARLKGLPAC